MRGLKKTVAALLVIVMTLCGCSRQTQSTDVSKEHPIQIGVSFDSLVIERWIRDRDAFTKYAKDQNVEVNVQNANGDVSEQIKQIEYFMDQKVDVIVIIPVDCYALSDVVSKARKIGIKIISYDRLIQNANVDLYISFDNEKVGCMMAESMIDQLSDGGNIIEIGGSKTDQNVTLVEKGFENTIGNSNLKIIYKANCVNWEADEAVDYLEDALAQNDQIKGIMCGNDDIATRVCQVLSEHRMAGDIIVVGQDADLSACQRIVEGTQSMTVFKQCENMAELAAMFAIDLANNKDITGSDREHFANEQINDGTYEVPFYKLDPISVTSENMDAVIIESGFHDRADVYLNVLNTEESE